MLTSLVSLVVQPPLCRLFRTTLKEDAAEEAVREVFRIASEKTGYGKMKAFAVGMLKELQ